MLRGLIVLVLLGGAGLTVVRGQEGPQAAAPDKKGALKKAMLVEAEKAFEQIRHQVMGGKREARAEELYQWSRRWLEGQLEQTANQEQRRGALQLHLDRMQEVERLIHALARAGRGQQSEASAATYFRLQAELWLEQGELK